MEISKEKKNRESTYQFIETVFFASALFVIGLIFILTFWPGLAFDNAIYFADWFQKNGTQLQVLDYKGILYPFILQLSLVFTDTFLLLFLVHLLCAGIVLSFFYYEFVSNNKKVRWKFLGLILLLFCLPINLGFLIVVERETLFAWIGVFAFLQFYTIIFYKRYSRVRILSFILTLTFAILLRPEGLAFPGLMFCQILLLGKKYYSKDLLKLGILGLSSLLIAAVTYSVFDTKMQSRISKIEYGISVNYKLRHLLFLLVERQAPLTEQECSIIHPFFSCEKISKEYVTDEHLYNKEIRYGFSKEEEGRLRNLLFAQLIEHPRLIFKRVISEFANTMVQPEMKHNQFFKRESPFDPQKLQLITLINGWLKKVSIVYINFLHGVANNVFLRLLLFTFLGAVVIFLSSLPWKVSFRFFFVLCLPLAVNLPISFFLVPSFEGKFRYLYFYYLYLLVSAIFVWRLRFEQKSSNQKSA